MESLSQMYSQLADLFNRITIKKYKFSTTEVWCKANLKYFATGESVDKTVFSFYYRNEVDPSKLIEFANFNRTTKQVEFL